MATEFSEVYASFLSKVTDYSFLNLTQDELEEQLEPYLRSSIPRFRKPRVNLKEIDSVNKEFFNELSILEIEILATLMVIEFMRPKINSSNIYKQVMTDKEFRFYSQANHLAELMSLYNAMKKEAEKLMLDYSFERLGEKDE
jgi:hypothetical protein